MISACDGSTFWHALSGRSESVLALAGPLEGMGPLSARPIKPLAPVQPVEETPPSTARATVTKRAVPAGRSEAQP
jgi:phage tail tape-measure protein